MNQQALANELNRLLAIETRGLTRHLREATPYLTASTYPLWDDIQRMLATTGQHAQRLSQLIAELEMSQRPVSFAPAVAHFHYTDLGHMLPLLIEEKRSQVTAYQRAIEHAGGADPAVVSQLETLLADHQVHLDQLERHHNKIAGGSKLAQHG